MSKPRTQTIVRRSFSASRLLQRLLQRIGLAWRWWPSHWLSWRVPQAAAIDYRISRAATRLESLEPRILLSADLMPASAHVIERVEVQQLPDVTPQAVSGTSPGARLLGSLPSLFVDVVHQQWPGTNPDLSNPTLTSVGLVQDSGSSGSDRLSNSIAVQGQVADDRAGVKLLVALDPASANAALTDLSSLVQPDGRFTINQARLATLAGGTLAQGQHTLRLLSEDAAGNRSAVQNFVFTLDSLAPAAPSALALLAASDTGTIGDLITSAATVSVTGKTEAGAVVTLGSAQATADANGAFRFDNVALTVGSNTLNFSAKDAAGNVSAAVPLVIQRDNTAPAAPSALALLAASDTGTLGDLITSAATVSATGTTEAGAVVTLGSAQATADANGAFRFDNVALTVGSNTLNFSAKDAAGNVSAAVPLVIQRTLADSTAPVLSNVHLALDSGSSATDHITNSVTLLGVASDNVAVAQMLVALDPVDANAPLTDLSSLLQSDGSFTLDRARLDLLAGGSVSDGAHTVRLVLVDGAGNRTTLDFSFTLQTANPVLASLSIASADTYNGDSTQSAAARVTLRGTLDAGATISLASQSLSAQAGAGGVLQLPDVALSQGANTLSFTVTDAAGNSSTVQKTFTRVQQSQTDQVLGWNSIALKAIQLDVTDPPVATRTLAMQSLAVYDVLAAIEGTPAYVVQRSVSGPVSADVAVAVASHRILSLTYPAQRAQLDAALAASLALVADGAAKDTGIALGLDIANAVWASRQNDGSAAYMIYNGSTAVGAWRPTGPNYALPDDPQWGSVTPFALTIPSEFRPAAPPALDTAAYADAINQVKSLGSASSSTRTA
ncbi:MAG: hypothetical protein RJA44_2163, partial [Pseudomonadota bacterium]